MGLDMYLDAKYYVWYTEKEKIKVEGVIDLKSDKLKYLVQEVAYWRKANHIHKWFVDNVQDGVDDCGKYTVTRNQLNDLLQLCKDIIKSDKEKYIKSPLLPTQSGFFFGGTEYDDWYFKSIEMTIEYLTEALKLPDDWSFEYSSSW